MTEIQYELRERDLLAFNDHQLKSVKTLQKSLQRHQATIPGLLVLISIFVWFGYQDSLTAAWIAITGGIWGVAAPFLIRWQTRRKISRMYSNEDKARILGEYTLRIEPQALIEVSKVGESHIKWEDILRIEAGKNYAFIFVTLDSALIIPRATVKKGNIAEFFDEVEHRLEKAA
ncbi:MAG: YcxB family protein [Methylococcaceae bacterium]|jgi:hypothetical protein|nr:YcxB family protein [Methylococcaceae bacterium]